MTRRLSLLSILAALGLLVAPFPGAASLHPVKGLTEDVRESVEAKAVTRRHEHWTFYTRVRNGSRLCLAVSPPTSGEVREEGAPREFLTVVMREGGSIEPRLQIGWLNAPPLFADPADAGKGSRRLEFNLIQQEDRSARVRAVTLEMRDLVRASDSRRRLTHGWDGAIRDMMSASDEVSIRRDLPDAPKLVWSLAGFDEALTEARRCALSGSR